MGVAVGSPREVEGSLREAEARPWRRMLAPVRVIAPPAPVEITFTLPARLGGATIDWTLAQQGGDVHEGKLNPDDLPVTAAAEVDGESYRRWRMALPSDLPHGYHRLSMAMRGGSRARGVLQLILTPVRCHGHGRNARLWGLTAQLYGVRSQRNWGIGDFTDLAELAEQAAALGASAIGVNPLHALFPADASHISPYSPSSRLFLNVCYLDPEAVPDFAESSEVARHARRWRLSRRAGERPRRGASRLSSGLASEAARARTPVRVIPKTPPRRVDRAGAGVP